MRGILLKLLRVDGKVHHVLGKSHHQPISSSWFAVVSESLDVEKGTLNRKPSYPKALHP